MKKTRHVILFDDDYEGMIKRLIKEAGYSSMSDVLRAGIRRLVKAEFGESMAKVLQKDKDREAVMEGSIRASSVNDNFSGLNKAKDPASYCVNTLGGQIVNIEGKDYCQVPDGYTDVWLPIHKK